MKMLFFIFVFGLLSKFGYSQNVVINQPLDVSRMLVIYKANSPKSLRYNQQDYIQLKTSRGWVRGHINFIADSIVFINEEAIPINEIKKVKYVHNFLHGGGYTMILGAGLYLPLVALNRGFNQVEPILPQSDLITSAVIAGLGTTLLHIHATKIKVKNSRQVKVLNFNLGRN